MKTSVINGHKKQVPTSQEIAERIAKEHVNWFLDLIRPLLISHLAHGFKHGQEFEQEAQKIRK